MPRHRSRSKLCLSDYWNQGISMVIYRCWYRSSCHCISKENELIDVSICNPPFHSSLAEARQGTLRKINNLTRTKAIKPILNFSGQYNELCCEGGEKQFVLEMIHQSLPFDGSCFWFSTLISKQENLKSIVVEVKIIQMSQGNKTSRFVAWTFLNLEQQKKWVKARWDSSLD